MVGRSVGPANIGKISNAPFEVEYFYKNIIFVPQL